MPTKDREGFVHFALQQFLAQTYPCKEMIVVDDGEIPTRVPKDRRIKYVRVDPMTPGEKNNVGTSKAQGEYIAHWDDDDWFSRHRLALQIEPIALGHADMTGFHMDRILKVHEGRWFVWRTGFPQGSFVVRFKWHDSTTAFHRRVWDSGARYTHRMIAEKVEFVHHAFDLGFTGMGLLNRGNFVYGRHDSNLWQFPDNWLKEVPRPRFFSDSDLEYYRRVKNGAAHSGRV